MSSPISVDTRITIPPYYGLRTCDFLAIRSSKDWQIDIDEPFELGSLRTRITILGANRMIQLSIPVRKHPKGSRTSEIEIDYIQKWQNQHWRSIQSAYGKSPFFEFYKSELEVLFSASPKFLIEFTVPILQWIQKQFIPKGSLSVKMSLESDEKNGLSLLPLPGLADKVNEISEPEYQQVFGNEFVPRLSILDALFCNGPRYVNFKTV